MRTIIVLVLAAALVGPVAASSSSSAPARTAAVHVRIEPTIVRAGSVITAIGRGWPRDAGVELLIGPPYSEAYHVNWARTTHAGTFRKRIRISSRTKAGRWVLLACRRSCRVKASASFRVTR